MNILVTGANGFVGRNLVENLKTVRDGRNHTRPGLRIGKVDIDMWPMLAMRYSVSAIPLLIYFKNGEPVGKTVGLVSKKEIAAMLDA